MALFDLPYFFEAITTSQSALLGCRISFWDVKALLSGHPPPSLLLKKAASAAGAGASGTPQQQQKARSAGASPVEGGAGQQGSGDDQLTVAPVTVELRLRGIEASSAGGKKLLED